MFPPPPRNLANIPKKQGLRIGLYDPLKRAIADATGAAPDGFGLKVVSGLATGALAICVASPTDLVKVRMQVPERAGGLLRDRQDRGRRGAVDGAGAQRGPERHHQRRGAGELRRDQAADPGGAWRGGWGARAPGRGARGRVLRGGLRESRLERVGLRSKKRERESFFFLPFSHLPPSLSILPLFN